MRYPGLVNRDLPSQTSIVSTEPVQHVNHLYCEAAGWDRAGTHPSTVRPVAVQQAPLLPNRNWELEPRHHDVSCGSVSACLAWVYCAKVHGCSSTYA